ncbi:MAG TPA: MOSC domain-containing protein [Anaerolineae bacterium]|nr:MOSC domain-containing protein [Anaerolineae bacterium]
MKLLSVNVGQREMMLIGGDMVPTGIGKRPWKAPLTVGEMGLVGDVVADGEHHGGVDQAVYVYSREDYAWWEERLGRTLEAGMFGENLMIDTFGEDVLRVGDRFVIGETVLELTSPRIPCSKLATKMGDNGFVKQFVAAERPGAYARVIKTGTIQMGDRVERQVAGEQNVLLLDMFRLWYMKEKDMDVVRQALASPIAIRARRWLEQLV